MVNNYRRDTVMARKPGYRMRGSGNWIAPRAGSYYRTLDDDMYYRGAGFRDWIKNAASTAYGALLKFIVPHIKQSGPDLAQMLTKYAANKATDYIKRSNKLGPAEGLVSQALSDLPGMVKDIVQKQLEDKFEPLAKKTLDELKARGGAASENREVMAQQAILDALPYIEEELEPLRTKLSLIQGFGEQMQEGRAREAHAMLEKLSNTVMEDNPHGSLTPVGQLVETMITAVLQYLSKTHGLPVGLERMADACCRMCSQNSTMAFTPVLNKRLQHYQELGVDMGPKMSHVAAILPGIGTYEIDPEEKRGGIFGVGSMMLGLLPSLVTGAVSLIGRAIDASNNRGSGGPMDLEKEMTEVFTALINKSVPAHKWLQTTNKRQSPAITGPKRGAKRQKLK